MWAHCESLLPLFDRHLIAVAAADDVLQGEHSQESLLQPILMTSLSLPAASASANSAVAAASNIGKSSGSHFDKPLNTSAAASGSSRRDHRGHGGCARSRIGKRNDEPSFLVKLYEEPQRLFMARSEADIFNGAPLTAASTESQCTLWLVTILINLSHMYMHYLDVNFFAFPYASFFFYVNCNRSILTLFDSLVNFFMDKGVSDLGR